MQLTKSQQVTVDISPEEMANLWWLEMGENEQVRFFNQLHKLVNIEGFGGNKEYDFVMQLQYITDNKDLTDGGRWIMKKIGEYSTKQQ